MIIEGPQEERQRFLEEVWSVEDVFEKIQPQPKEITDEIISELKESYLFASSVTDGAQRITDDPSLYWDITYWGTRGDLGGDYSISEDGREILFDTHWSPCVPIIKAMSKQYPSLSITYKYFESGAEFGGEVTFMNGEGQDNYYAEGISHGFSYEDYWRIGTEFGFVMEPTEEEEDEEEEYEAVNWQEEGF